MKVLLLILCLSVSVSAQRALGINSDYDRFKDETVYRVTESLMPDRPGYVLLSAIVVFKGESPKLVRPKSAFLRIESNTDEWYFLHTSNVLRIIQDGERYEVGKMQIVDSMVHSRSVSEWLLIEVPFAAVEKMASAKRLELQVGRYETELKPSALENLRRWTESFTASPK